MNKKIASFVPNFWQPHLETDAELIKRHLTDGDTVRAYICNGELPSCYGNLLHEAPTCKSCVSRRRNAFDLVGLEACELQNFVNISEEDEKILAQFRGVVVETIEQLRAISLEECNIGRAVFNELASHVRETEPDLKVHREYVTRAIESGALVYLSFKRNFAEYRPDLFYTFNGRFVIAQAAVAAAKSMEIPFAVHDRAFSMNRYTTVFNESLHSFVYWSEQAEAHWNASTQPLEERLAIGDKWFEERLQGKKQGWYSFTTEQTSDLPYSFDPQRVNIAFFNTSEFETVGMDHYRLPLYDGQNQGIERIARDLLADTQVKLYLRVHPNLKDRVNTQTREIREQLTEKFPNLEVIPADSAVSTYNLMRSADAVVTFGSTTGAEAAYYKRPVILLGKAYYQGLDFCYIPSTHEELIETIRARKFVLDEAEAERRRLNALKYAYFMSTSGNPFEYFEQTDVFDIQEKVTKSSVSYSAPPFEKGLKKELAARNELKDGARPNSLSGLVKELAQTVATLDEENQVLKAQLANLQRADQNKAIISRSPLHKISSLGRSFRRRLRRFL